MKNERSAGGIIFRKDDGKVYFLLLHYSRIDDGTKQDKKINKTYWEFPKGHVEEGETEVHTLIREAEEETGIKDLRIIEGFREKIKYFFNYKGQLINKEVIFFLCETKTGDVKISEEHIGFEWATFEKAKEMVEFKNSREVLIKAHEFLSNRTKLTDW